MKKYKYSSTTGGFHGNAGFSFAELMVVVGIILILGVAIISSSKNILKNLRFQNYFNQMIFMTQEARSLAASGKDPEVNFYTVQFDTNGNSPKITVLKQKTQLDGAAIDSYLFDGSSNMKIFSTPACATVSIQFENGSAKTTILCDQGKASSLILGVQEKVKNGQKKSFSIHQVAGIPQVN